MKSRIVVLLFVVVSIYIVFNRNSFRQNMFTWDCSNYYLYLPAVFIYHDIDKYDFYPALSAKYEFAPGVDYYNLYDMPTGRKINKYAIGTALFELPFFLGAHLFCLATHSFNADGYTLPYQFAGILCYLFWVSLGLLILAAFLRRQFNENIAAFTILCIAFGTNLYCYTTFLPGMSHPFEFVLFSAVLYLTDLFYSSCKSKYIYWLGFVLGMIIITRPTDIVVALIPFFWQVGDSKSFKERLAFLRGHTKGLIVSFVLFFAVSLIQMSYWKYTSGHWIHYSYHGEGFRFLHPHITDGLFGYQKGWFVYTPVAFVALFGFFCMKGAERKLIPAFLLSLVLMVYIVFSWRIWWYGGGFGARALIDALPLVAFMLAFLFRQIYYTWKNMVVKVVFSAVISFLVTLNLFQTFQYSHGTIHWVFMSKAYYWRVFGKVTPDPEDYKLLMSGDEYFKEVEEANQP